MAAAIGQRGVEVMCGHCFRLQKAAFDPFVVRDDAGGVCFANRELLRTGRFSERHWPVFRHSKRHTEPRMGFLGGPCSRKLTRSIDRAANVSAARRWIPISPLEAQATRVEDALNARRGIR